MKALTLRNIPPAVARAIERRARRDKTSLGAATMAIVAEAAGITPDAPAKKRDLSAFTGSWSKAEADAFDRVLEEQRQIDPDAWK